MPTTAPFFILIFSALVFCICFLSGIYLCIQRKPVFTALTLQRLLGIVVLLLSSHVLLLTYGLTVFDHGSATFYMFGIIAFSFLVLVVSAFIMQRKNDVVTSGSKPAEPVIQQLTGINVESPKVEDEVQTVAESSVKELETEKPSEVETEMELTDEGNPTESEENIPDDSDNVEPLVDPNLEDMIFFQKVEVLMATKRLFCEQELSRDAVAAAVGTNRTYLIRSIKGATGKTFLEYITDLRTSYAATLLTTTDEPLDIIGTMVGFRSKSSYYRAFSAAYGCTPSEYRRR